MKITLGDVTITIEPGDDPNQVIAMAKAIGGEQDSPKPVKSTATVEAAPSKKRVQRCAGRGECYGLYHASDTQRHIEFMCETYEYIASYKHGRTSMQVANWASITQSAAASRIKTLIKLDLVKRPGRSFIYVATASS